MHLSTLENMVHHSWEAGNSNVPGSLSQGLVIWIIIFQKYVREKLGACVSQYSCYLVYMPGCQMNNFVGVMLSSKLRSVDMSKWISYLTEHW